MICVLYCLYCHCASLLQSTPWDNGFYTFSGDSFMNQLLPPIDVDKAWLDLVNTHLSTTTSFEITMALPATGTGPLTLTTGATKNSPWHN
eukprot:3360531-Ditylum_brightwellii.AAC.2